MSRRLATYVYLTDGLHVHAFGPDDDLPDWAVKAIPNPKAWQDEQQGDVDDDGEQPEPDAESSEQGDVDDDGEQPEPAKQPAPRKRR